MSRCVTAKRTHADESQCRYTTRILCSTIHNSSHHTCNIQAHRNGRVMAVQVQDRVRVDICITPIREALHIKPLSVSISPGASAEMLQYRIIIHIPLNPSHISLRCRHLHTWDHHQGKQMDRVRRIIMAGPRRVTEDVHLAARGDLGPEGASCRGL